ncbi:hypothetical protein [Streptomyces tropicalis]|uniref:Uncharacterized protein n=1 Tax=Streptomyces tropicalis TaxID=3034234 RepID=A0ABT6ACT1_9ACTN|nr:hypothetical protein [Streptomyces tropicalis]MDF3302462.1 hypothetical protein [Streptomyces tropicalis]
MFTYRMHQLRAAELHRTAEHERRVGEARAARRAAGRIGGSGSGHPNPQRYTRAA